MSELGPRPRPTYEGPFGKREERRTSKAGVWLSPWRLYSLGAIVALGITAFYLLRLTFTKDMFDFTREPAPPPEAPRASLSAYCLPASGGVPAPVRARPFCTEAAAPACRAGDSLQLTYTARDPSARYLHASVVGADLRHDEVTPSRAIRSDAADVPLGQWKVRANGRRSAAAVVGIFSRQPIGGAELAPWYESWRRERVLARPPELPASLRAKGAVLSAFLVCLGR